MLRWYQTFLKTRPVLASSLTTAVLFGAGDTLAQQAVERKRWRDHDFKRTGRMVAYGGLIFGPLVSKWFAFLEHCINLHSRPLTILARVLIDQTVGASVSLGLFLSTMALWEGQSPQKRLEMAWPPGMKANWSLWPAVQTLNFTLVPLQGRVVVANVVNVGWNCYLSGLNRRAVVGKREEDGLLGL